jgi:hypothetical protein
MVQRIIANGELNIFITAVKDIEAKSKLHIDYFDVVAPISLKLEPEFKYSNLLRIVLV